MGVVDFFGDRLRGFRQGFTQGVREQEQAIQGRRQAMDQSKTEAVLQGHQVAMEMARQYGLPGSPQWADAYATIAAQSGVPQPYIDQVRKLTVNPKRGAIDLAKENTTPFGRNYVNPEKLDSIGSNQPQSGGQAQAAPEGKSVFDAFMGILDRVSKYKPAAQSQPMTSQPTMPASNVASMPAWNAASAKTPWGTPSAQPETPMQNPAMPAAQPTQAAQAPAAGSRSWRDLFRSAGQAFANIPPGDSLMPPEAMNLDVVTGNEIPEDAVREGQTPTTMKDIGIETPDDAEQFQALETMVGKSLPEGFDLRVDFARDPEFYMDLLKAIREGVKDEKTGGKRKLSTQEIISLIVGE